MNLVKSFYSQEPINTKRQINVDMLKATSVIFMVICHCVIFLSFNTDNPWYLFADEYLGGFLGAAPAFMLSMGIGFSFSSRNNPKSLFKRGLKLLMLGYILNVFRTAGPSLLFGADLQIALEFLTTGDILQFAGLATMLVALFKKIKCPSFVVLLIAIIMSATDGLFNWAETDNSIINNFINEIVPTSSDYATFNLFSWFIYVVIGMFIGDTIKRVNNLDKFYLILILITLPLGIGGGIYFHFNYDESIFFYGMNIISATGFICCSLFLLSVFHFLSKVTPKSIIKFFSITSKNITIIYCLHWLAVGPLYFYMLVYTDNGAPIWATYIFGIVLFLISFFLAIPIGDFKNKILLKLSQKRK